MPYNIQFLERDAMFLQTCAEIPNTRRIDLLKRCKDALANISDDDRLDRIASARFRFLYLFRSTDGMIATLRFIVDESATVNGVLRVLYADVVEGKPTRRLETPYSNTA